MENEHGGRGVEEWKEEAEDRGLREGRSKRRKEVNEKEETN